MEKKNDTDAERIAKDHGGSFTHGSWDRISGMTSEKASACAAALKAVHYQVRHVVMDESSAQWSVIFR